MTDEEALAEEERLDAFVSDLDATAAPLPVDFNGYSTTYMNITLNDLVANVSFQRPMVLESDYNMNIDIS